MNVFSKLLKKFWAVYGNVSKNIGRNLIRYLKRVWANYENIVEKFMKKIWTSFGNNFTKFDGSFEKWENFSVRVDFKIFNKFGA